MDKRYRIFNWTVFGFVCYMAALPVFARAMRFLLPQIWRCSYLRMTGQPCPFCGLELKKPPKRTAEEGQLFLNNIQLTQEEATRFRLNVEDALLDRDNDGFSNIFEIRVAKTSPVDPRSHSPMWYRLRLQEIRRVELPIKFMAVNTNSSDDKSRWDLQLNMVNKRNREITSIEAVGNTIELDNKTYKIADIKLVKKEIPAETKGGTPRISDESVMYLEQVEGTDKLELQVGKKVFSSRPKAIHCAARRRCSIS